MEPVDVRGRFVWHQLMTRDVPGAKQFYAKLTGWKTMAWPLDPSYTVCHADIGPVAGIMEIPADMPAEVPAHWTLYIGTRDVDATADAAVRAGGSVVKAPDNMAGAGRYAVLKDPQGAVFAVIDPENAKPDSAGPAPLGTFAWHELATTDHEAAFAFYSGLFGWEPLQRMDMGPSGIYLIFGQNGVQRGGIYIKPADMPAPPSWLPYAQIPECDASTELAKGAGASVSFGPMTVPGGSRVSILMDPTGAPFAICSTPATAAETEAATVAKPKSKAKARPAAKVKAAVKPKAKAKVKAKARPKSKAKAKAKPKKKAGPAKKPAARKKVVRKAARKAAAKKFPRRKK